MFAKPTYKFENRLYKQGYKNIAGLDEVGRGAWAGPVVAAAVILPPKLKIKGIRDSKLLSPKQREALYIYINKKALGVAVGIISEKIIDSQGIIVATRMAFLKAIKNLKIDVDYLLVDGWKIFEHEKPTDFLIKGDNKIVSVAAASIIAKVTRDHILMDYHQQYPHYNFAKHKGYGTKEHRELLYQHGLSKIHRSSWQPMVGF